MCIKVQMLYHWSRVSVAWRIPTKVIIMMEHWWNFQLCLNNILDLDWEVEQTSWHFLAEQKVHKEQFCKIEIQVHMANLGIVHCTNLTCFNCFWPCAILYLDHLLLEFSSDESFIPAFSFNFWRHLISQDASARLSLCLELRFDRMKLRRLVTLSSL